jgi:tol-pal system protein YbgF
MRYLSACLLALPLGLAGAAAGADAPPATAPVVTSANDAQGQIRLLAERLTAFEQQLQNHGVLTLLNQLADLKDELARLRGQQEELAHSQQLADKRLKDFYSDVDARLKALAKAPPAPAPVIAPSSARVDAVAPVPKSPATPAPVDPDADAKAYEAALGLLKDGNHSAATKAFQSFIQAFPNVPLTANAMYWLGLSLFSQGDFRGAGAAQQRLLKEFPQSSKVPDAMVNLARTHLQLGEGDAGRHWLDKVIAEHPTSKAADTARKMQNLNK